MTSATERWELVQDGRRHVVEIAEAGLARRLSWTIDEAPVAHAKTSDDHVVLPGGDHGTVGIRLPKLTGPARRVTLYDDEGRARTGIGGTDLDPEPGSRAAAREAWIREHPHLHTARRTAAAAAWVVAPLVGLWLLSLVPLPRIHVPFPDIPWPDVPWPDLPSIPWPDVAIPWPDLPDLPGWVDTARKFVLPVLVAFFIARSEVKRRHRQDEDKRRDGSGEDVTRS